MNNFSFSDSVFKKLVLQTCKNQGLFEKRLKLFFKRLLEIEENVDNQHLTIFPQCCKKRKTFPKVTERLHGLVNESIAVWLQLFDKFSQYSLFHPELLTAQQKFGLLTILSNCSLLFKFGHNRLFILIELLENIVDRGENAGYQYFLLFSSN